MKNLGKINYILFQTDLLSGRKNMLGSLIYLQDLKMSGKMSDMPNNFV